MMPRLLTILLSTAVGMVLPAALCAAAERVEAVSPGGTDKVHRLETACPTFSWTLMPESQSYDLLVYTLDGENADLAGPPLLRRSLPGGATSWTPAAEACLPPGRSYLWVVRGVVDGRPTAWSAPRTFAVSTLPSVTELRQVLGALAELEALADPEPVGQVDVRATAEERSANRSASRSDAEARPSPAPGLSVSGTAAIRGAQFDAAGDTLGVVGTVDSADGAGVAAANSAGGADLLLDGLLDGETDTVVSQAGLDRASADAETFELSNSGAGEMTLLIDGVAAVTTATDSDTLAGLSCTNNQIARWNGASWECATNQGGDTLAGLSCTDGQIVHWNGAAWVCGQPDLQFETCGPSGSCSMTCPPGTIVWVGGCEVTSGSPSSISKSFPTSPGAGQPPTGWQCAGVNPIGGVSVVGYLYCVGQ